MKRRAWWLALLLLLVGRAAFAAPSEEEVRRARAYFEAGRALYSLGRYEDALREFTAGYQLVPKPEFLINLGQAYRRLGRVEEARMMYQRFLVEAPPGDPHRAEVDRVLGELGRGPPPPPVLLVNPPPPPAVVAAPPEPIVVATPPPRRSFIRRHWWIIPVSAVVVAGVAVGIYFGVRHTGPDCGAAALGCVDASHP